MFIYIDLPPLRDTSTSSLRFYQQREESALLQPEFMTPSPTQRTPANIRTSTTGTSPIHQFEESSHPFHRLNPYEENSANTGIISERRSSNIEHDIQADQSNFDTSNMDTSHQGNERNINTGRGLGSDESL